MITSGPSGAISSSQASVSSGSPFCSNESRHDAAIADIDGLGVGSYQAFDIGAGADGDDAAVGDGERLGRGARVVDGQYGSGDDEVCIGHLSNLQRRRVWALSTGTASNSSLAPTLVTLVVEGAAEPTCKPNCNTF